VGMCHVVLVGNEVCVMWHWKGMACGYGFCGIRWYVGMCHVVLGDMWVCVMWYWMVCMYVCVI